MSHEIKLVPLHVEAKRVTRDACGTLLTVNLRARDNSNDDGTDLDLRIEGDGSDVEIGADLHLSLAVGRVPETVGHRRIDAESRIVHDDMLRGIVWYIHHDQGADLQVLHAHTIDDAVSSRIGVRVGQSACGQYEVRSASQAVEEVADDEQLCGVCRSKTEATRAQSGPCTPEIAEAVARVARALGVVTDEDVAKALHEVENRLRAMGAAAPAPKVPRERVAWGRSEADRGRAEWHAVALTREGLRPETAAAVCSATPNLYWQFFGASGDPPKGAKLCTRCVAQIEYPEGQAASQP